MTLGSGLKSDSDAIVRRYASFDALPGCYQQLFKKKSDQPYEYTEPWFRNFVRTALDQKDQVCIYGLERTDDARALAALPMCCRNGPSDWFRPSRLRSLSNFYSLNWGPLCEVPADLSEEAAYTLAHAIRADRWDSVDLHPLDSDSPIYSSLAQAFRSVGMVVQEYFCFGNWYLLSRGLSYVEYFNELASAMQNTLRRKMKKLEKSGRARIEIFVGTDADSLERAINAYVRVYLSSWKVPEPYPEFMPGLIRTCAEQKWLRLGMVYLDEEPIAAQLWIVHAGRATIYKLAHDQRYDEFSAGSILTARLLEHVLDVDKVHEIDYGSGDDPYKKTWLPQRRERWGILGLNPRSIQGCIGIARHVGGQAIKHVWDVVRGPGPNRSSKS